MAEVARLAGVSVTTVSHVINGTRPGERAHAPQRAGGDRAHRLPPEHDRPRAGPRRHAVARAWRSAASRTRTSSTSWPRSRPPPAAPGTRCCSATRARTPSTSCGSSARWPSARSTGCCWRRRVGALEHALPYLESQGVPVVLLDRFVDVALDQVGCDNEQPTARLVEHLIDLGHRRIAMAIGIPGLCTTDERVRGYRMALEQAGLAFDPALRGRGRLAARPGPRGDARAARPRPTRRPRSSAATTS